MKKILLLLALNSAVYAFAGCSLSTISQAVRFSGFPQTAKFATTSYYSHGDSVCPTSVELYMPSTFPPHNPYFDGGQNYKATCGIDNDGDYCNTTYSTQINYGAKSCLVTIKLNMEQVRDTISDTHTERTYKNSVSGDCTITGRDGDDLWMVKPK